MCERCDDSPIYREEAGDHVTSEEAEEFSHLTKKFEAWQKFGLPTENGMLKWGMAERVAALRLWDRLEDSDKVTIATLISTEMAMESAVVNGGLAQTGKPPDFKKAASN